MLKSKKILIVLSLLLIILFSSFINCFAGIDFDVTDEIISKANTVANGSDYVLFTDVSGLWLCILDDNCYFYVLNNKLYSSNGGYEAYALVNEEFIYKTRFSKLDCISFTYYYTTKDVMNGINTDDVFFRRPPLTLKEIMEVEGEKKTIQTTLVGLAKLLIPLLVCLVGFWKAWHLLSRILHKV